MESSMRISKPPTRLRHPTTTWEEPHTLVTPLESNFSPFCHCCSPGASALCFFWHGCLRAFQIQQLALLHILKVRRFKLSQVLPRHRIYHCGSLYGSILPLASQPSHRQPAHPLKELLQTAQACVWAESSKSCMLQNDPGVDSGWIKL